MHCLALRITKFSKMFAYKCFTHFTSHWHCYNETAVFCDVTEYFLFCYFL